MFESQNKPLQKVAHDLEILNANKNDFHINDVKNNTAILELQVALNRDLCDGIQIEFCHDRCSKIANIEIEELVRVTVPNLRVPKSLYKV